MFEPELGGLGRIKQAEPGDLAAWTPERGQSMSNANMAGRNGRERWFGSQNGVRNQTRGLMSIPSENQDGKGSGSALKDKGSGSALKDREGLKEAGMYPGDPMEPALLEQDWHQVDLH